MRAMVVNFIAFQIGWFACVVGAARDLPWIGVIVAVGVVALHLRQAIQPKREVVLIACAAMVGLVLDSILVATDLAVFKSGMLAAVLAPPWMIAMWIMFATTLNVTMRWLRQRAWLAAAIGAVSGPMAYYSGAALGAVSFGDASLALGAIALGWAIALPLLMEVARRCDGVAGPASPGFA